MKNDAAAAEAELDSTCSSGVADSPGLSKEKKRTSEAIFNHTKPLKCT